MKLSFENDLWMFDHILWSEMFVENLYVYLLDLFFCDKMLPLKTKLQEIIAFVKLCFKIKPKQIKMFKFRKNQEKN